MTPLTVSQLAEQIKDLTETAFPAVWVSGEISNFTRAASGHMYLTLKDPHAAIRCAFFRGFNLRLKFDPRDGLEVLARGRVSFYPARGDIQLYIEELQPKGLGAAELALRQLKERLLKKGYFAPERKRSLPTFPTRVALVASSTGAAVRDMIELFAQRWPAAEIIVRHSRVQGETAGQEIAAAVRELSRLSAAGVLPLDAIIVGRGGGSSEDLAAFNEEWVADAIFNCSVPVVSAVGHEIDVTIADLVADRRAETPSAAVVALTPNRGELLDVVADLQSRLTDIMSRRIELSLQRLTEIESRPAFRNPLERVREREQRLDDLTQRLDRAAAVRLELANRTLAGVGERLQSLSPLNVLARGYSLTQTPDGTVVKSVASVAVGDVIVTRLADGTVTSRATAFAPEGRSSVAQGGSPG